MLPTDARTESILSFLCGIYIARWRKSGSHYRNHAAGIADALQ
jgi:hypothetical protein